MPPFGADSRGFYELTEHGARLWLRVTPGAKSDEICGLREGVEGNCRLVVKVTAPPDKGKANAAVVEVLAAALGVPKSALTVASGGASRLKTMIVSADPAEIAGVLDALTGDA